MQESASFLDEEFNLQLRLNGTCENYLCDSDESHKSGGSSPEYKNNHRMSLGLAAFFSPRTWCQPAAI
jgi:hypothetical protein